VRSDKGSSSESPRRPPQRQVTRRLGRTPPVSCEPSYVCHKLLPPRGPRAAHTPVNTKRIEDFEPRRVGALQAYLRQAVLNRIRNKLRRKGRQPHATDLDGIEVESVEPDDTGIARASRRRSCRGARQEVRPAVENYHSSFTPTRARRGGTMLSRRKQYMDGNGRMGRFLMNVMMAAGGISLDGHTRRTARRLYGRS
jgi:hypothetical protein